MTVHAQPSRTPVTLSYQADLCGNIEQALKALQGYGVMALELIQNADDAHATSLTLDACENGLFVRNNATFTTCGLTEPRCPWEQTGDPEGRKRACNFHAISKMGGRSKVFAPGQIGRFGIGFVSVYQVTDTPIIRSAGTQLLLNPFTGEAPTEPIASVDGTEFELPWASSPSDIREALNASMTPPDVAARVVDEVTNALRTSLLFLRNLEYVEIRQDGVLRASAAIKRGESYLDLAFGPERGTARWMVLARDASDLIEQSGLLNRYEVLAKLDRSPIVSIAIPVDGEPAEGLLYAYLPTTQSTGMPLHVNGDFFPHASRQNIVLSGEGHERYWNEMLLAAAAAAVGERFELLRDTLGHNRLWEIGRAAFNLRESGAFSGFWKAFSDAAKVIPSVWTTQGEWRRPDEIHMAPQELSDTGQVAVSGIGIDLLHPSLRPHWTELSAIGVAELRLSRIATSLEALGDGGAADDQNLRSLWAAVATMIDVSRKRSGFEAVIERLKAATFFLDLGGRPVSPVSVWRLPKDVRATQVLRYVPDCPIVHTDVMIHGPLLEMIDEFGLDEFASSLAADIMDPASAEARIGTAPDDVRGLYELLTCFPLDDVNPKAGLILANTPFLRTALGFVSPSKGQLPGGFRDPIGHFEFVDARLFPPGMESFSINVLDVAVLSFREYIDEHLEEILLGAPSREQYGALLTEIVEHRNELHGEGSLELLAKKDFVRTRSGAFVQPDQCYYWSAALETLLGDDSGRWVDEFWIPAPIALRFRDLLEHLGMPTSVSTRHIVDRIEEIASQGTPNEVVESCTPVIRHVIDRWARLNDRDIEILTELRRLEFLPAQVNGERDGENLYLPEEVYRAGRAAGFASQVPVVDLAPLRQSSATVNELLDLLKMPSEPPTRDVVAHLQSCMANGAPVHDLTYSILNERVERADGVSDIDQLAGTAFIFQADSCYLRADQVFWVRPPFRGYWHTANSRMRQREPLYRRLGVEDEPNASHYGALILEVVRNPDRTESDLAIHARCLGYLAEAFERGEVGVEQVLDELRSDDTLFNVNGESIWPREAIWLDSEHLALPFGDALNERLVRQPDIHRTAAARLFRRLGTAAISEVAHLRLAAQPDNRAAPEDTDHLRARGDLLLWLAPNQASRSEFRRILKCVEIRLTESLRIQAEIAEFDPPVRSRASPAPAFYDRDGSVLHVKGAVLTTSEWTAAFRALFSEIERLCPGSDVKPLIMTASLVMLLPTHEEAEQALRQSDLRPPDEHIEDIPLGEELGEVSEEQVLHAEEDVASIRIGDGPDEPTAGAERNGQRVQVKQDTDAEEEAGSSNTGFTRASSDERAGGDRSAAGAGEYKSKGPGGAFGSEPQGTALPSGDARTEPKTNGSSVPGSIRRGETQSERQVRRSRMLAYVGKAGARGPDDSEYERSSDGLSALIDAAAIAAALKYEEQRGWSPEEQPHGNPGYDILSTGADGKCRLIEVKGLEAGWTDRGIKLSHVQYNMAENHPDEYWIYVVENARDLDRQQVNAISNPFNKVEEYWFDHNWRDIREESATGVDLNIRIGAKLQHQIWEVGTIIGVERRGVVTYVTVDFGFQGKKYIPYNSQLKIVG